MGDIFARNAKIRVGTLPEVTASYSPERTLPSFGDGLVQPAQTSSAGLPGDVLIFRNVTILMSAYPLSKYAIACSGNTPSGWDVTRSTRISPSYSGQQTTGLLPGDSCGAN